MSFWSNFLILFSIFSFSNSGKSFFQGPWLLPTSEISVPIHKQCFRQELLLSSVHDVTPIIAIVGRCGVLEYHDYTTLRPTEIQESDVFITESVFDELKKCIKKMDSTNCIKKFKYSEGVTVDEILHFKQVIKPLKVSFWLRVSCLYTECFRCSFVCQCSLLSDDFSRYFYSPKRNLTVTSSENNLPARFDLPG